MFKKLFGGGSKPDVPQPVANSPAPTRKLLLLPESEAEWVPVRAADVLEGESLLIQAALLPRSARDLQDARVNRKRPGEGTEGRVELEDMGGGEFGHTLMPPAGGTTGETLAALPSEPFPALLYAMYDGRRDSEEGLMVLRLQGGTVLGFLPADGYSLYNHLLLNLELRTGVYGVCNAKVTDGTVQLDLARYEICYNRCQRLLDERQAGAIYLDE